MGSGAFMTAASPGVISLFFHNDYYPSETAYLEAISEAMKPEYEAIVAAGFDLQIDCPDLAMGRHIQYATLNSRSFASARWNTSRRSTPRSRTFPPSEFACISAGATTRVRIIAMCRSPISSTSCS